MREWYRKNAERARESARLSSLRRTPEQRHAEYLKRRANGYRDPHRAAHNMVTHALERGDLIRGQCERIDEGSCRGRIEAHHDDYDKPLDVRWLCRAHHAEVHRKF